jgi:hypothetical protein
MSASSIAKSLAPARMQSASPGIPTGNRATNNRHAGRAHFWRAALAGLAMFWGGLAALVVIAPLA